MEYQKELSWEDLGKLYSKHNYGRSYKILSMDRVFNWAESRADLFRVLDNGSIVEVNKSEDK